TGSLVTRCTTDITDVKQAFQMTIRGALRGVFMSIFSIVMAFKVYDRFAMVLLIVMPFLLIIFVILSKSAMPIFEKMFDAIDNLNNILSENIHGIRVVKAYNREDQQVGIFEKQSKEIYDFGVNAEMHVSVFGPIMNFCMFAIIIILSYIGSKAILKSGNNPMYGLTTGGIMSLVTYSLQMLMSLMMMTFIFVMIVISTASLRRLYEVVSEKSDIVNPENPVMEVKSGDIEFINVDFGYRGQNSDAALSNVSIKINEGESIGIIGGTGSGKSSFVNLIPRLYDVKKGVVKVGGVDVRDYDIKVLRKNIGMVLQKNVLFSGTIESNLKFASKDITHDDMVKACTVSNAMEFIEKMPDLFDSKVEQGGTNFSGGQKQRLCIARALLKKPKILIFDDSTSQKILTVMAMDKIMVLDDGKIVAYDTHDNLMKNCSIYKELYDLQQRDK
ncbi:MAG: ABC transporter ATP-binding protein/permease, partial [Lachnospiraceae bacterium]|nr:ABC transporter ATP-binding protein/permease [Lachnospiraceae bacterium]